MSNTSRSRTRYSTIRSSADLGPLLDHLDARDPAQRAVRALDHRARPPRSRRRRHPPPVPQPWPPHLRSDSRRPASARRCLAFLWPLKNQPGFGGQVNVGAESADSAATSTRTASRSTPRSAHLRRRVPEEPRRTSPLAKKVYKPAIYKNMSELSLVALYQRCVHLGCRVPFCDSSQWFECPCHGSKYNRVGEKKAGPAPRGPRPVLRDRQRRSLVVDTGTIFIGPPIGTNTTGQNAEGPRAFDHVPRTDDLPEQPFVIAALWKNDLRHWLIWLNIIAFVGLADLRGARRSSRRKRARRGEVAREPHAVPPRRGPRRPAARTGAGLGADLRGDRRDRVADLLAARADSAEPVDRPTSTSNSVARGAHALRELLDGRLQRGDRRCSARTATAPRARAGSHRPRSTARRSAGKRRRSTPNSCGSAKRKCTQIITYGRPGTPMQAWGVLGGGPKNDQAISDLVAYINSIQLTPAQAKQQATDALDAAKSTDPTTVVPRVHDVSRRRGRERADDADDVEERARHASAAALLARSADEALPNDELKAQCDERRERGRQLAEAASTNAERQYARVRHVSHAIPRVPTRDQAALGVVDRTGSRPDANVSDGQILFELELRPLPHRRVGRSSIRPRRRAPSTVSTSSACPAVVAAPGEAPASTCATAVRSGASAPTRTAASPIQSDFVTTGSEANKAYGILGIGTGRMPGFGSMLTADQIKQIVSYERYCLANGQGDYTKVIAPCVTGTEPRDAADDNDDHREQGVSDEHLASARRRASTRASGTRRSSVC